MKTGYYFDVAQRNDEVFVVDDLQCFMRLDEVVDIFYSGKDSQEKYIQLNKSNMIIGENQKHILFHKSDGAKLNHALDILRPLTERDWIKHLPALMEQRENEPMPPPVPKEGKMPPR